MNRFIADIIFININDTKVINNICLGFMPFLESGKIHLSFCITNSSVDIININHYINTDFYKDITIKNCLDSALRSVESEYICVSFHPMFFSEEVISSISNFDTEDSLILNFSVKNSKGFVNAFPENFNIKYVLCSGFSGNLFLNSEKFFNSITSFCFDNVYAYISTVCSFLNFNSYNYLSNSFIYCNADSDLSLIESVPYKEVIIPIDKDAIVRNFLYGRYGVNLLRKCIGAWFLYKGFRSGNLITKRLLNNIGSKLLGENYYGKL